MSVDSAASATVCPVCAALPGRIVYGVALDPLSGDRFQVMECAKCQVAYTSPRPASLDRYYPRKYRDYGPLVSHLLGIFYETRVARWARIKPEGGRVLEIGCGPGLMLSAFARRGWNAQGIERNEAAAARARQTPGLEISTSPIESLPLEAKFDLIIMFHVLEHIGDPVALLAECAKRLAPGGRLILNVPNFSSWQSRFAGPRWLHLDVPRHLIHFTPQTLAETLQRAGLGLTGISYASLEHDPYGWVESALNRMTSRPNTLTRFLMGIEPFGARVMFSLGMGALLSPLAFTLALASWVAGRGALMEGTATVSTQTALECKEQKSHPGVMSKEEDSH